MQKFLSNEVSTTEFIRNNYKKDIMTVRDVGDAFEKSLEIDKNGV